MSAETNPPTTVTSPLIGSAAMSVASRLSSPVYVFSVMLAGQVFPRPFVAILKRRHPDRMACHAGFHHRHRDDFDDTDIADPVAAQFLEVLVGGPFRESNLPGEPQYGLGLVIDLGRFLKVENLHDIGFGHAEMLDQMGLVIVDAARAVHFGCAYERDGVQEGLR